MKTHSRIVFRLALALAALALNSFITQQSSAATFTNTGALSGARAGHTATLLRNGTVLVLGGYDGIGPNRLASSELYRPAAGSWTNTAPLHIGRTGNPATLLPNGKVLVTGGHDTATSSTATCELYDPATGLWTETGSMAAMRGGHTSTLLRNGKVLVAGGYNRGAGNDLSTAELYDPDTGMWTATGLMTTTRVNSTATLLLDGRVLVAGGVVGKNNTIDNWLSSAELYDPATGKWTATGPMISERRFHTATLLPDGRVLVTGGDSGAAALSGTELYNPGTGIWRATAATKSGRSQHTATLLPDGKILIAGGYNGNRAPILSLSSAELYDPSAGTWTAAGTLNTARDSHTATLLSSGEVLIAAGYSEGGSGWLSSAELYASVAESITLVNPVKLSGGAFQFAFAGAPNGTYAVSATTDLAAPLANWSAVAIVAEFAPGLFVFSDPQAANGSQRFYVTRGMRQ